MTRLNQDALDMIEQLRDRLTDLEEAVLASEVQLSGLSRKIDRVDDKVYLLVSEVEKAASRAADDSDEPAAEASPRADEDDDDDGEINILTPEAKEKIGETVGDMRVIGREAVETFTELNEAFSDITGPFKTLTGRGRR